MGLRTKILSGFLILSTMLFVAGLWSVYELTTVGTSVQSLLDDNYESIQAARAMIEALEREDSAVLLLLSGEWKEGRSIFESADHVFQNGFTIAENNVTIPGERAQVDRIRTSYRIYKDLLSRPIVDTSREGNLKWYFEEVHRAFLDVKTSVERLMAMNDRTMYRTASALKDKAYRAVMPGVVAILSALVFTLMFNYFITLYMVNPIIRITKGIQRVVQTGDPFDAKIETDDELSYLASSIQQLVTHSQNSKINR